MFKIDDSIAKRGRITAFSNKELTPELAALLGNALGTYLDSKAVVMIGRDYRRDTRMLKRSFSGGLLAAGIELIDLHGIPTSVLQFTIRRFGADCGVMFTRSHNLAGMVSIKIFDSTGIEYKHQQVHKVVEIAKSGNLRRVSAPEVGWITVADAMKIYDRALAGFFASSSEVMKKANLQVVLDCACGPASRIMPDLLNEFGCEVITLNAHRPRNPLFLPNPSSLARLRHTVRAINADLGIAIDAEARHALIIDSQGRIRTAEETASVNLHSRYDPDTNATVVVGKTVNPSVYRHLQKNIVFSDHGEGGGISRAVLEHRAIYGFNDTGLFVLPVFSPGSDAIVASFTVLAQIALTGLKSTDIYRNHQIFSQRLAEVAFPLEKMFDFFKSTLNTPPDGYFGIDTLNGIKLIREDNRWIHLYLATGDDTLQIEVFDPDENTETQTQLIEFARNIVSSYLS